MLPINLIILIISYLHPLEWYDLLNVPCLKRATLRLMRRYIDKRINNLRIMKPSIMDLSLYNPNDEIVLRFDVYDLHVLNNHPSVCYNDEYVFNRVLCDEVHNKDIYEIEQYASFRKKYIIVYQPVVIIRYIQPCALRLCSQTGFRHEQGIESIQYMNFINCFKQSFDVKLLETRSISKIKMNRDILNEIGCDLTMSCFRENNLSYYQMLLDYIPIYYFDVEIFNYLNNVDELIEIEYNSIKHAWMSCERYRIKELHQCTISIPHYHKSIVHIIEKAYCYNQILIAQYIYISAINENQLINVPTIMFDLSTSTQRKFQKMKLCDICKCTTLRVATELRNGIPFTDEVVTDGVVTDEVVTDEIMAQKDGATSYININMCDICKIITYKKITKPVKKLLIDKLADI